MSDQKNYGSSLSGKGENVLNKEFELEQKFFKRHPEFLIDDTEEEFNHLYTLIRLLIFKYFAVGEKDEKDFSDTIRKAIFGFNTKQDEKDTKQDIRIDGFTLP